MKLLYRIAIIVVFLLVLTSIIAFARGYRLDLSKKSLTSTGIISVSSWPKPAKVFINGELKGVTDINLTLPPGHYKIEIKKDGYTSWEKTIDLKGELVLTADGLLYPLNPSLAPLTNLGIIKAESIPESGKILLFSETESPLKDGIYLFDNGQNPLSFLPPLKLLILKNNIPIPTDQFSLKDSKVFVSPDNKQAIFEFASSSYLLSLEEENTGSLFDITASKQTLLDAWDGQRQEIYRKILEAYPKDIAKIATDSFQISAFSPDETKVLYQAKSVVNLPASITPPLISTNQTPEVRQLIKGNLYLYDRKEDKNFSITINNQDVLEWYSDSKHLVINDGKKLSVMDYDGTNNQTIYSGPFDNSFFNISSDGKIMILTNLNPDANKYPDLYTIGIR